MVAADIFRPDQWNDFFLLVGTGAVTLTGLVFVAMSLNLKVIAVDATHRYRAINPNQSREIERQPSRGFGVISTSRRWRRLDLPVLSSRILTRRRIGTRVVKLVATAGR